MSIYDYRRGFCKTAERLGVDPFALARIAVKEAALKKAKACGSAKSCASRPKQNKHRGVSSR